MTFMVIFVSKSVLQTETSHSYCTSHGEVGVTAVSNACSVRHGNLLFFHSIFQLIPIIDLSEQNRYSDGWLSRMNKSKFKEVYFCEIV